MASVSDNLSIARPIDTRCGRKVKRTGEACKRHPIPGGTVCPMHGGAAPQVKAAAAERLKELAPKAITVLDNLLDEPNPFVRLAAAKDVLDRNGVGKDRAPATAIVSFTLRIDRGDDSDQT